MCPSSLPRLAAAVLASIGLAVMSMACTEREATTGRAPLPVAATAYPSPTANDVSVAKSPPEDTQELRVEIVNDQLDSDRYSVQSRPVRIRVTSRGGPYTLSIDQLLQPQHLTPDSTTAIGLTVPDPGDYTVRLGGAAGDTAILNVRSVGAR